jgi:hypothetical protein
MQAEVGISFDRKDYKKFLELEKKVLARSQDDASSWAGVASAYACLYAETGQDSLKTRAVEHLQKSKTLDSVSEGARDYINRIEYRLWSRNIISSGEFQKKFPNGWAKTN